MQVLDQFRWALRTINADWEARADRSDTQIRRRDSLPAKLTSSTLRYLRISACRRAGVTNCACWESAVEPSGLVDVMPIKVVRRVHSADDLQVDSYPCSDLKKCSRPTVPMVDFSTSLGISFDDQRRVRRWMNSEAAMSQRDFRKVVANAFANGWLSANQAINLAYRISELDASTRALRRLIRKIKDRRNGARESDRGTLELDLTREHVVTMDEDYARGRRAVEVSKVLDEETKAWLLATDLPQNSRLNELT